MRNTAFVLVFACVASLSAQQAAPKQPPPPAPTGYKDTPMQPNGKWHIHDDDRPRPPVVTPGPFSGYRLPPTRSCCLAAGRISAGGRCRTAAGR